MTTLQITRDQVLIEKENVCIMFATTFSLNSVDMEVKKGTYCGVACVHQSERKMII